MIGRSRIVVIQAGLTIDVPLDLAAMRRPSQEYVRWGLCSAPSSEQFSRPGYACATPGPLCRIDFHFSDLLKGGDFHNLIMQEMENPRRIVVEILPMTDVQSDVRSG